MESGVLAQPFFYFGMLVSGMVIHNEVARQGVYEGVSAMYPSDDDFANSTAAETGTSTATELRKHCGNNWTALDCPLGPTRN